jgi:hypothetical protein
MAQVRRESRTGCDGGTAEAAQLWLAGRGLGPACSDGLDDAIQSGAIGNAALSHAGAAAAATA